MKFGETLHMASAVVAERELLWQMLVVYVESANFSDSDMLFRSGF